MTKKFEDYLYTLNQFNYGYYLENNNLQVASALSALLTTAKIQRYYLNTDYESKDEAIARLYSLLQGLFVSIDSLYVLSYAIGKSKNYININTNEDLRKLRYIRNDVVGHPANRKLVNDSTFYCILDDESINDDSFDYHIYSRDSKKTEKINVNSILNSYYDESIIFLNQLVDVEKQGYDSSSTIMKIDNIIKLFVEGKDSYYMELTNFFNEYKDIHKDRLIWRYEIIQKLKQCEENDIINYCIFLELVKIAKLANSSYEYKYNIPKGIKELYRFLNRHTELYTWLDFLNDSTNPMFEEALYKTITLLNYEYLRNAIDYLIMINDAYKENKHDLVYALALPLKEYKKKK